MSTSVKRPKALGPWKDFAYKQTKNNIEKQRKKLVVTLAIWKEVTREPLG